MNRKKKEFEAKSENSCKSSFFDEMLKNGCQFSAAIFFSLEIFPFECFKVSDSQLTKQKHF